MKNYLLFTIILLSNQVSADCFFSKDMIEISSKTGGSLSCQDKEYYLNQKSIDRLNRKGIDGNCIGKDNGLQCKSGTLIQYESINYNSLSEQKKKPPTPIKSFSTINEPQWNDRPKEPGDWYGESCLVRVWEVKDNGSRNLIMYRHGGRNSTYANIEGNYLNPVSLTEQVSNSYFKLAPKGFSNIEFVTTVSVLDASNKWNNSLVLLARKSGKCGIETQKSQCVRADGFIVQTYEDFGSDAWRLKQPVKVIVEDSCAKHKNSNFLEDRPWWSKIGVPH
jgi:hypothetical protein